MCWPPKGDRGLGARERRRTPDGEKARTQTLLQSAWRGVQPWGPAGRGSVGPESLIPPPHLQDLSWCGFTPLRVWRLVTKAIKNQSERQL